MRIGVVGLVLPTLLIVPMAVHDINAAKVPPPTAPFRARTELTAFRGHLLGSSAYRNRISPVAVLLRYLN